MRLILSGLRRLIAFALAVTLLLNGSYAAWADAIQSGAQQAAATAAAITPKPGDLYSTDAHGDISFWPNSASPTNVSIGDLYRGATGGSTHPEQNLYGDDSAMGTAGAAAHQSLQADPTTTGDAYRTLIGSMNKTRPDLTNDPVWTQTDQTLKTTTDLTSDFGDCSTSNTFNSGVRISHIPDYKTCERITDNSRTCQLAHYYRVGVLEHVSGPLNLDSCGSGCVDIWIGTVGDNYWGGMCSIFEQSIGVNIFNPTAVQSAHLSYVKWDDYIQIFLNNSKVWSGPDGRFPPETDGPCELKTEWQASPNADVTAYFKQEGRLDFKIRVSVGNRGEGYAKIRVRYDPAKIISKDEWTPPDCEKSARGIADGFCSGTAVCTDMPLVDADGCATLDGIKLCPGDMPPIGAGLSPLCRKATINAACDFYKGQMDCWTDPQGQQHCPNTSGENLASCTQFEQTPGCGFISSSCLEGAMGASGACYVVNEIWDCGHNVSIPTKTRTSTTTCDGTIRCMGTECVNPVSELNSDFGKVSALLQAAQFMAMDADCNEDTTEVNRNCTVFKGKKKECKKAVGGIVDCCNQSTGVSLADYVTLIMAVGKLDGAVMALDKSSSIRGAWETMRQPIDSAWTEVQKPFVSAWENIWGGSEAVADDVAAKGLITTIQQELMEQVAEWTTQAFGEQATNLLFSRVAQDGAVGAAVGEGAGTGALQLGGGQALIGTALSWVMTAYTIYSITMILIKMIWACEQSEFELAAQKQLKNCHYVGGYCKTKVLGACIEKRDAYCCFNSPLSRIIQEQVRPQLGMPWGAAKSPSCDGLTPEQLTAVDWTLVDLSEWLGILAETGHLPDESKMTMALTGAGSSLNLGARDDAATRAVDRVNGVNAGTIRNSAGEEVRTGYFPR